MRLLSSSSWLGRLAQGLLGLLGFYVAVRLFPRVLKSMTRRFVVGLIGEILLVAVATLLTERATRSVSPNGSPNGHAASEPEEHPR